MLSGAEDLETKQRRWLAHLKDSQIQVWSGGPQVSAPSHLHHYSSLANIEKIISGRELWLFDVCTMQNDPGDGRYRIGVFHSVLIHKSVPAWLAHQFQPGKGLGIGHAWYSYVSCFSSESGLEDQWEQFADHGTGCAIEISFAAFINACDGGKAYAWTPMLYDPNEQADRAERTVDKAIQLYRSESAGLTSNEAQEYWKLAAFSFLWSGTRFKDPKFEHQHEWRVFLSRPSEFPGFHYCGQRRYMRWSFPKDVVTGLVKGPACDRTDDELVELLTTAGYPTNVRQAELKRPKVGEPKTEQ